MSAPAKLWVGNLPPGIPDRDVEEAFSKYGTLRNCWVARKPPGFGFGERWRSAAAGCARTGGASGT